MNKEKLLEKIESMVFFDEVDPMEIYWAINKGTIAKGVCEEHNNKPLNT